MIRRVIATLSIVSALVVATPVSAQVHYVPTQPCSPYTGGGYGCPYSLYPRYSSSYSQYPLYQPYYYNTYYYYRPRYYNYNRYIGQGSNGCGNYSYYYGC